MAASIPQNANQLETMDPLPPPLLPPVPIITNEQKEKWKRNNNIRTSENELRRLALIRRIEDKKRLSNEQREKTEDTLRNEQRKKTEDTLRNEQRKKREQNIRSAPYIRTHDNELRRLATIKITEDTKRLRNEQRKIPMTDDEEDISKICGSEDMLLLRKINALLYTWFKDTPKQTGIKSFFGRSYINKLRILIGLINRDSDKEYYKMISQIKHDILRVSYKTNRRDSKQWLDYDKIFNIKTNERNIKTNFLLYFKIWKEINSIIKEYGANKSLRSGKISHQMIHSHKGKRTGDHSIAKSNKYQLQKLIDIRPLIHTLLTKISRNWEKIPQNNENLQPQMNENLQSQKRNNRNLQTRKNSMPLSPGRSSPFGGIPLSGIKNARQETLRKTPGKEILYE